MPTRTLCLCALLVLAASDCNKSETRPVATTTPRGGAELSDKPADKPAEKPPTPPAEPPLTVGMLDPFPHLTAAASKPFNSGWASLKAKKYDEAAASFSEVSTLLPDYLTARFQAARAYLLAANAVAARQQLEALLSRSYLAYSGRVASKEFAPFRTSPEWPAFAQKQRRLRTAYAQGLGQGLIVVARSSAVDPPSFAAGRSAGVSEAKLDLRQEAYHYDAATGRFRPLTATEGRVVAALRSPDGQRLAFVTAERLGKDDKTTWLAEVQFGFIDLTTLETAGPLKLAGGQGELTIGFGKGGTPLLTTPGAVAAAGDGLAAGTYEIDTARTGLTQAASDSELVAERLIIRPDRVIRSDRPGPAAVTLADDRHSLKLGSGGVITSARLLADSSLAWSPDQRYFVYAGRLDGCAAQREERQAASPSDPAKPPPNELYLYEVETKAAARIDAAPSAFDSQWLSDSLLAYELGAGGKSSIALYDLTTRKKSLLPLHDGAGFAFLPTFSCAASVPPPPPPPPPPPAATP